MHTTYEMTQPWWRAEPGPDHTVHLKCEDGQSEVTVRTNITDHAARGLYRQLGRVLHEDNTDPTGSGYSIKELMDIRSSVRDPKAILDEAREEIIDVIDAYARLIEAAKAGVQ